jgi:hypothetical protein
MFKMRFGIHTGDLEEIEDVNYCRNVCGNAINTAQRIMDCGDEDHILCSDSMESAYFRGLEKHEGFEKVEIREIGEHKVKHGVSINLYNIWGNYNNKPVGNETEPETKWNLHVEIDPQGRPFPKTKWNRYLTSEHTIFVGITNERLVNHLYETIIEGQENYQWKKVEVFFLHENLLKYFQEDRPAKVRLEFQREAINKFLKIVNKHPNLVYGYQYETFPNFGMTCLDYRRPGGMIRIHPYIWGEAGRYCPAIYYNWDERKPNSIYWKYTEGVDKLRSISSKL